MGFLFGQQATEVKPRPQPPPITDRQKWMTLARFVKKRYKTDWDIKEIAAELSLADYKRKKKDWEKFKGVI